MALTKLEHTDMLVIMTTAHLLVFEFQLHGLEKLRHTFLFIKLEQFAMLEFGNLTTLQSFYVGSQLQ